MGNNELSEQLRALASDVRMRSKASRLREVFDDVEAALAAGVQRSAVVETLAKHGLEMTLATFDTSLKRIRDKRGKQSVSQLDSAS
jgi:molecular chaperone GrpE (heat shock protein)